MEKPRYGCFDFGLELYGFVWISYLDICLWIVGCRKPNPRMNYVWKLTLIMNPIRFGMDLWLGRIIIVPKHGVLLGFHLNPK